LKPLEQNKVQRILLISFNNIGDSVLSLPVFESLKNYFKDAVIDVVVGPRAEVVYQNIQGRGELLIYQNRVSWGARYAFFKQLKDNHYDLVVDLKRTYFSFLGRHKTSFFYPRKGQHKRDQHLSVLAQFGIPIQWGDGSIGLGKKADAVIVLAPGAMSHLKQWPMERFAALADRLIQKNGCQVQWIGSKDDTLLIEQIQGLMERPSTNLAKKGEWSVSIQSIRESALLITNDSAPLHIADHYKIKTLALFGPTNPESYGPQHTSLGVLSQKLACQPCEKAQCSFKHECMNELTVDTVYHRATRLLSHEKLNISNHILVIRLDRIGDVLLTFPALEALKKSFEGNAIITWMTRPYAADLASRCPDVDDVLVYDYAKKTGAHRFLRGYLKLVQQLRKRKYKAAFICHPNLRSYLLCWLAGIPIRVGYDTKNKWMLTHLAPDQRRLGENHESQNTLDIIRAFDSHAVGKNNALSLFEEDFRLARELLGRNGWDGKSDFIVIHPDASSNSKRWPEEHFARLISLIKGRGEYSIVLVGHGNAMQLNQNITQQIKCPVIDLSNQTPLIVLAAICRLSKVVVSNDSGPAHIAAASGANVVSIFGRTEPGLSWKRWKPLGSNAHVVANDIGCAVCLAEQCPINFECLKTLAPERVLDSALKLLV
jgi:lipopolysaccharide heptosyltransferase II